MWGESVDVPCVADECGGGGGECKYPYPTGFNTSGVRGGGGGDNGKGKGLKGASSNRPHFSST